MATDVRSDLINESKISLSRKEKEPKKLRDKRKKIMSVLCPDDLLIF